MKGFIEVTQETYRLSYPANDYVVKGRKILLAVNHITQVREPKAKENTATGRIIKGEEGCDIYTSDGPEDSITVEQSYDEVIKLIEEARND